MDYKKQLETFYRDQNYTKLLHLSQKRIQLFNRIVLKSKQEVDKKWLQEVKIYALVGVGQYKKAIWNLNDYEKKYSELDLNLKWKRVYCLYKVNQLQEALSALSSLPNEDSLTFKHLEAQICYKLENYEKSCQLYQQMLSSFSPQHPNYPEILNNYYAAIGSLFLSNKETKTNVPQPKLQDTFEGYYNLGCALIGQGQFHQALEYLDKSLELCQEMGKSEEMTEKEVELEMAPIMVQKAYIYQQIGQQKEAQEIYSLMLSKKLNDFNMNLICLNNLLVLSKKDQQQWMKQYNWLNKTRHSLVETQLLQYQKSRLYQNAALLALAQNKPSLGSHYLDKLDKQSDLNQLIHALYENSGKSRKDLLSALQQLKSKEAELCILGCLFKDTDYKALLEYLKNKNNFEKFEFSDQKKLLQVLLAVLEKVDDKIPDFIEFLHQNEEWQMEIGIFYFKQRNMVKAQEIFSKLKKTTLTQSALILCTHSASYFLPSRTSAAQLSEEQKSQLLSIEQFLPSNYATQPKELIPKKKKRKLRKKILPKDYQPGKQMDPERWLPKVLRKGYKPKRRRRGQPAFKGPQGQVSDAEPAAVNATSAPGTPPVSTKSSNQKQQQKKKKKGKNKW